MLPPFSFLGGWVKGMGRGEKRARSIPNDEVVAGENGGLKRLERSFLRFWMVLIIGPSKNHTIQSGRKGGDVAKKEVTPFYLREWLQVISPGKLRF